MLNRLLLHCPIAYELWSMVWTQFGLLWFMPHSVTDLFSSWQGSFNGHQSIDLWRTAPHCVLRQERNSRCFEENERSILKLKSLLFHTLLEWSSSFNLFPCSNFLEILNQFKCLAYCYPCTPPVYLDFCLIQFICYLSQKKG